AASPAGPVHNFVPLPTIAANLCNLTLKNVADLVVNCAIAQIPGYGNVIGFVYGTADALYSLYKDWHKIPSDTDLIGAMTTINSGGLAGGAFRNSPRFLKVFGGANTLLGCLNTIVAVAKSLDFDVGGIGDSSAVGSGPTNGTAGAADVGMDLRAA